MPIPPSKPAGTRSDSQPASGATIRFYQNVDTYLQGGDNGLDVLATRALRELGILAKETHGRTIRFSPPLVITEGEVDWALARLAGEIDDLRRLVELAHRLGEKVEGGVVVEGAGHEPDALGEGAPHVLPERGAGPLPDGVVDDLPEVLVLPVPPGETDEREAGREQPAVREVVDRRHELLRREVPGDPEEHERTRAGDLRQPLVTVVPQRVPTGRDPRRGHPWARSASAIRATPSGVLACSRRTGRPVSWRTAASPPACAAMN